MGKKIKLSVLDQSPVRSGGTFQQAIQETVQLAKLADKLHYNRFWVSEHHNIRSVAGSTPEVLMAHLASQTSRIRIGSGGVMLPNHSAFKVAENFKMLETLFPGRIDLGIGRAPGGDRYTASLLNPSNTFSEQDFIRQMADLQQYMQPAAGPLTSHQPVAIPLTESSPEYWLLTSSGGSAMIAAHFGMGAAFAQFINPSGGPEVIRAYRERFRPSQALQEPQASVAVIVICADEEEKLAQLRFTAEYQLLQMEQGKFEGYPSYDSIKKHVFSDHEMQRVLYHRERMITGTPATIRLQLTELADLYQVNEIIAVTITYDFADRLRSYELLAEAFNLAAADR